ncbi:MAG: hypothetical protein WBV61_06820 [Rhodanobacteraceae bacterium]
MPAAACLPLAEFLECRFAVPVATSGFVAADDFGAPVFLAAAAFRATLGFFATDLFNAGFFTVVCFFDGGAFFAVFRDADAGDFRFAGDLDALEAFVAEVFAERVPAFDLLAEAAELTLPADFFPEPRADPAAAGFDFGFAAPRDFVPDLADRVILLDVILVFAISIVCLVTWRPGVIA